MANIYGLIRIEIKIFEDLLIKANNRQLEMMCYAISQEVRKRKAWNLIKNV